MSQSTASTATQKLTFEEYLAYQGEPGILYELYRGHLIQMATPTGLHTRICNFLVAQLRRYFAGQNLALVAINDTGIRTEEDTSRIPDIVVCTQSLWEQICNSPGAAVLDFAENPLLVVEITSQNWREDYLLKRAEYALREIPEYWIVDPNKFKIRVCSHPENEDGYEHREFLPGQEMQSAQFAEFIFPVNQVLSPPIVEDLIREEQQARQQLEQRANEERQRADEERQRADRLAQRLREMGIDPDAV